MRLITKKQFLDLVQEWGRTDKGKAPRMMPTSWALEFELWLRHKDEAERVSGNCASCGKPVKDHFRNMRKLDCSQVR